MDELQDRARLALACLDLTQLGEADTSADVDALCVRARSRFGDVAAVCTWPRFVAQARSLLPASIKVAAVANFPAGDLDLAGALADIQAIATSGGDEIDVVLPYRALMADQVNQVAEFLGEVRLASRPLTLKVIIESGELMSSERIGQATRMALAAGADFVKTSTGKSKVSATLPAARTMLTEIAVSGMAHAGFKASGGVRTVAQAMSYLQLVEELMGQPTSARFRIGASSLLDDIEAVLGGTAPAAVNHGY